MFNLAQRGKGGDETPQQGTKKGETAPVPDL